jgi:hypothetical protein
MSSRDPALLLAPLPYRHINGKSSSRVVLLTRNLPLSEKQYRSPALNNKPNLCVENDAAQVPGAVAEASGGDPP